MTEVYKTEEINKLMNMLINYIRNNGVLKTSRESGLSKSFISDLVNGKRNPSIRTVDLLLETMS
ncbi:MAG: helix-turn-helix transcriptional regulator [bacterium]|nr:helix-turn-helix transcriptional regulator [bacterium]